MYPVDWSTFYKRFRLQTAWGRGGGDTDDCGSQHGKHRGLCKAFSGCTLSLPPSVAGFGNCDNQPGGEPGAEGRSEVAHRTRVVGLGRSSLLGATRRSLTNVLLSRNRATQRPGRPAEHAPLAPSGLLGSTGAAQGSGHRAPPGHGPRPAQLRYWARPGLAGARRAKKEGGREPRAAEGGGEDPAQSVRTGRALEVGHGAAAPGPVISAPAAE